MHRTVQWLNANRYRSYPFIEDQPKVASGLVLPDAAIVDFRLMNYIYPPGPVRLKQFTIISTVPRQGIFRFVYSNTSATFDFSVPENAAFPFVTTLHDAAVHHVTCTFGEGIVDLLQNTPGTYVFPYGPPIEPALLGFQADHRLLSVAAEGATALAGIIQLMEGYNCQILVQPDQDTVRITASKGAGKGVSCEELVEDPVLCHDVFLRINGLQGNDLGDFTIIGIDGVEAIPDPDNNRIIIRAKVEQDELVCG